MVRLLLWGSLLVRQSSASFNAMMFIVEKFAITILFGCYFLVFFVNVSVREKVEKWGPGRITTKNIVTIIAIYPHGDHLVGILPRSGDGAHSVHE